MDFRDSDLFDDKKLLVRINTLNKMIKKRRERKKKCDSEIKQYQSEILQKEKKVREYSKDWKVNPQLKKKNQKKKLKDGSVIIYTYYQFEVKVWWKKSPIPLSIGNEETYQSNIKDWEEKGLDIKEELEKLGKSLFLKKLLKDNLKESMVETYSYFEGKKGKK